MRALTGCCALLAMLVGLHVHGSDGIAMHALPDGSLLYSLSAGNEDAQLLGGGLVGFGLTVFTAALDGLIGRWSALLWLAYGLNLALLAAVVVLVSLDNSLLDAASLGDVWPLAGVVVALLPLLVLLFKGLCAQHKLFSSGM